ncbi:MAG: glycosyltransferase family 39 protein [Anaerolineales bacterium]
MNSKRKLPLIEIVTLLGALLYVARSLYFAHSSLSIGDEGAYLFKGLVFARGEFSPFEDYGYWTNKAPLAFLIPGYIQYWFGAGLREARYFALAVSFLMLAGVWILANRLGGKNWAVVAMWVFALSDANTSIYSQALSQGLVACMLTWVFVCILGEKRPFWQLIIASLLSVLIVMTRQNMVVFLPLLVLYIFWQHGKKAGAWSLASSAALFILFRHIV